jgi:hypothetical protein
MSEATPLSHMSSCHEQEHVYFTFLVMDKFRMTKAFKLGQAKKYTAECLETSAVYL